MQAFKEYLIQEYAVSDHAAVELLFTHSCSVKTPHNASKCAKNHKITCTIAFYDGEKNRINKATINFVNNKLSQAASKKFINIVPGELENRFAAARCEITSVIGEGYREKIAHMSGKLSDLNAYVADGSGGAMRLDDPADHESTVQQGNKKPKLGKFDM